MHSAISSETLDPLIGAVVAGRYEIEAPLGAGAMGAVYRARQQGLDRLVALKVLRRGVTWSSDTVERFRREAQAMSALTHPNTVRVFDFGTTDDGGLYLAIELLHGSLCTDLVRDRAITPVQAVRYAQHILRSIGEAHDKGIIHRDLKPDNVFVADINGHDDPMVKVLDFGIAKAVEGRRAIDQFETQDGTVFGTPRYMSPEQAQGKALDPRSDLYAVGIILYEMLTGAPPFIDDDAVVVMAKHIRVRPKPIGGPQEGYPFGSNLTAVVRRALEKDPAARFQTARDFESALAVCTRGGRLVSRAGVGGGLRDAADACLMAVQTLPQRGRWLGAVALAVWVAMVAGWFLTPDSHEQPPVAQASVAGPRAIVSLQSEPGGAEVWRAGRLLGLTPLDLVVETPEDHQVLLHKPGYKDRPVRIQASDGPRRLLMEPLPAPPRPRTTRAASRLRKTRREIARRTREERRLKRRRPQRPSRASEPAKPPEEPRNSVASPYEKF